MEREIKFINERIKSLPAVNPPALVTTSFSTASSPTPGQAMTTPHTTGQIPLTEWRLPETLSQSTVFGVDIGSNACTIIAVMGAQKFLRGEVQIPSEQNINECVGKFACTMKEGNLTYNTLQLPASQPNLDVGEAINIRSDRFGMTILEDVGLFSVSCVENKLMQTDLLLKCSAWKNMCSYDCSTRQVHVDLLSPSEQKLALYESHRHQNNGGIIAVASYGAVGNFARYLALLCNRDWGTTIAGANITVLAALQ